MQESQLGVLAGSIFIFRRWHVLLGREEEEMDPCGEVTDLSSGEAGKGGEAGGKRRALSMACSRQEYWNGLPFPMPGDLPVPGIKSVSLGSPTLADRFFTTSPSGKPLLIMPY